MYKIACSCVWIFAVLISSVECGIMWRDATCSRGERCVEIKNCPYISQLLKFSKPPLPKGVAQIMQKQHCGFKGKDPLVCCSNNPDQSMNDQDSTFPLPPDVINSKNLYMLPTEDCGRMAVNYRITGGTPAELNEFPWMALLVYKASDSAFDFRCDGTIISHFYVLTAAHCVLNEKVVGVRLGEHNMYTNPDCDAVNGYCAPSIQDFYVDKIIVHPNYSTTKHTNDIALIRLSNPVAFYHENVQPICLPIGDSAKFNLIGRYLTVTGWGASNNGSKSPVLLQAGVPVVPLETCQAIYRNMAEITYKQICAGGKNGQDSCKGDSGGPLKDIVEYDGVSRYVQYGIVSYGPRDCGRVGYPAIYTNVAYYVDWILEVMLS